MDILARAKDLGIQTEFVDGQGHRHVTDSKALKIILDALPARPPYRFLDQTVVVRSGRPSRTELRQAAALPLRWKILAGLEVIAAGATADRVIVWPIDLPTALRLVDANNPTVAVARFRFRGRAGRLSVALRLLVVGGTHRPVCL